MNSIKSDKIIYNVLVICSMNFNISSEAIIKKVKKSSQKTIDIMVMTGLLESTNINTKDYKITQPGLLLMLNMKEQKKSNEIAKWSIVIFIILSLSLAFAV